MLTVECLSREKCQAVGRRHLTRFSPWLVHVGFEVNKEAIGKDFYEYCRAPVSTDSISTVYRGSKNNLEINK
jgi:hypothetical protein